MGEATIGPVAPVAKTTNQLASSTRQGGILDVIACVLVAGPARGCDGE